MEDVPMNIESIGQLLTAIVALGGLLLSLLNYTDRDRKKKVKSEQQVDESTIKEKDGNAFTTLNKAIELANMRAFNAEKRANEEEVQRKLLWEELEKLKQQFQKMNRYRLIFDVRLGERPEIEHAEIVAFPFIERRKETIPYDGEERRLQVGEEVNRQ